MQRAGEERVGRSTLYATHDQEETLALAQRIAVLKGGVCHQIGTPGEILHQPATAFVSTFLARQRDAVIPDSVE